MDILWKYKVCIYFFLIAKSIIAYNPQLVVVAGGGGGIFPPRIKNVFFLEPNGGLTANQVVNLLSQPQLNHNSTQKLGLTWNDFRPPTTTT